MKYCISTVPILTLSLHGEPLPRSPPVASLGVSVQSATSTAEPLSFDFEPLFKVGRRPKRRRRWLTFLSLGLVRERRGHLLRAFREIDVDRRGAITKEDLTRYAARNLLPTDYVDAFFSGVKGERQGHDASVKFEEFRRFVSSKEEALRRAFGMFDADGDGRIDAADLEYSLSHVRVCCPTSRCTYTNRKKCIQDLVAKVDVNNDKQIEFWEFRKFFMLLPQDDRLVEYWLNAKCSERCDVGGCVVIHDGDKYAGRKGQDRNPWGHLFAGAFAGAASRTATAPLETLRLSAMTGAIPADLGPVQAARSVCATQGWRSLYKGNFTNVLRSAPQKALDFFAFDAFKNLLGGANGDPGILRTFAAAGLAGATSNVTLYPLEVVRSRLTVDSAGKYKGVLDAFQKIAKSEGLGGLYRGVGPSVAAILPEAAIVYGLFDLSKKTYTRLTGKEPGLLPSLSFGVWSAFMGQVVAYPLETVSRRMQVQGMKGGAQLSFASCLNEIVKSEGISGLYRGLGPATARVIPMALVSFGTYEVVRQLIKQLEDAHDRAKAKQEYEQLHPECQDISLSV